MRDLTEGFQYESMRMPFLKDNLPGKLDEDEEYDRYYRRLHHHDGLIIRICANNYTILYQPNTQDWFWRSTALVHDKDADPETIKAAEDARKEAAAALKMKRRDRFMKNQVNNPKWMRGMSKDAVDEINQKFRNWIDGVTEEKAPGAEQTETTQAGTEGGAGAQEEEKEANQDVEMTDEV